MRGRIQARLATHPWLVWEGVDGRVEGYCYASSHRDRAAYRWSVDAAVYVGPASRGSGVARSLYTRLFEILTRQGFHAVFAGVTTPNPASEGLHRACGFELIGVYRQVGFKHGLWRDVGWWRRGLAAGAGQPADPTPFAEMSEHSTHA